MFAVIHVNTQHFAQQGLQVLTIPKWIASRSAISKTNVEVAIRTESQSAAVMIDVRLIDVQQIHFTGWVSTVRVIRRYVKACDNRIPIQICVIDIEQAILGISGMEGQPKQTLLRVLAANLILNIQEWIRESIAGS